MPCFFQLARKTIEEGPSLSSLLPTHNLLPAERFRVVLSQMNKVIIPSLVSPKEMVVGHEKSYLVRQIITRRVAFTTLMHLLHWGFVMHKVPGVDKEKDAVLRIQSMELERFHSPIPAGEE